MEGSEKYLPTLQQTLDGYQKANPPTYKMLPVEADVPEYLACIGSASGSSEMPKAVGNHALITYYYILCMGGYTVKSACNSTKQTVQFKLEDVTFFKKDSAGQLRKLPRTASRYAIMTADSATLKLDNQKNGRKRVCVHQEENGEIDFCPVRGLGWCYLHIQQHCTSQKCKLSAFLKTGSAEMSLLTI